MQSKSLRHFLYLNVGLVGAFLEQLEGGEVQITESLSEGTKRLQGGLNIPLIQVGGSGEHVTSYKETKTVYYELYNRLECALRKEQKLVDLSASRKQRTCSLRENQFFLAHGVMTSVPGWSTWKSVRYMLAKINDWLGQQAHATQSDSQLADVTRSLVLPDNRPFIVLPSSSGAGALPTLPEEPPEQIRSLIKPEIVQITLDRRGAPRKLIGSALLEHFSEDQVGDLISGRRSRKASVMGLTSELCQDYIRFIPLAVFVAI